MVKNVLHHKMTTMKTRQFKTSMYIFLISKSSYKCTQQDRLASFANRPTFLSILAVEEPIRLRVTLLFKGTMLMLWSYQV